MLPSEFQPSAGSPLALNLYVGEYFEGEPVPFSSEYVRSFTHFSATGKKNLSNFLPRATRGGLRISTAGTGTQVLAVDTHPNQVELAADKFNAYLRDEGLDRVIAYREHSGSTAKPGRERYRRHIKTLVSVDGRRSDQGATIRTGQRLEIVPLANPLIKRPGETLDFRVTFDDKPLVHALVKAWHRKNEQANENTLALQVRTTDAGIASFTLPTSGTWMLSVVEMLSVTDDPVVDWESYWGNLTFQSGLSDK